MNRRRLMMHRAGATPVLPAEYQRVEYIKKTSASSQAFMRLQLPSSFDNAEFKIVFNQPTIETSNMCMFGASVSGNRPGNYYNSRGNGVSGVGIGDVADFTANHFPQIVGEQTFELIVDNVNKTYQTKRNDTLLQSGNFTGNANGPSYLGLFGCFTGTTIPADQCGEEQLIYFSAKINNSAKFDLYPCYRKNDNVVGMFNVVDQTFITSANAGIFVKGADIN